MSSENPLFNPFPGLRPFQYGEQYLFFGREGQSEEILRHLHDHRFLAVVGTSGSGKSSLIRAGLLPDLHGGFMASAGSHWRVAIFRPAGDPIGNLARALDTPEVLHTEPPLDGDQERSNLLMEVTLRRGGLALIEAVRLARLPEKENILVIVDQFEELFRFASTARESGADDAAAFVKLLLEATQQSEVPIYVVITMRSDFIGDCARFRDLPEAVTAGMYLIPRMSRDQRRSAIEEPVGVGGGKIAPRLVNRLLNEVGDNPDQLPILQHALMRTWDDWIAHSTPDAPIDLAQFDAIGGLEHALSNHADEAYDGLPSDRHRDIAQKMFQCLTERGEDNREVRRPTTVESIAAIADAKLDDVLEVIEAFHRQSRSFLTSSSKGSLGAKSVIDISHESLIRLWQRLRLWVEEESEAAHLYKRLAEDAAMQASGKTSLWHDPNLQNALNWKKEFHPTAEWAARYSSNFEQAMSFLDKSCEARAIQEGEKERQRTAELRQTRKNLVLASTAVLFLLVVAAFAVAGTVMFRRKSHEALDAAAAARQSAAAESAARVEASHRAQEAIEARQAAETARSAADQAKTVSDSLAIRANSKAQEAETAREQLDVQAEMRRKDRDRLGKFVSTFIFGLTEFSDNSKGITEVQELSEKTYKEAIALNTDLLKERPENRDILYADMLSRVNLNALQKSRKEEEDHLKQCEDNIAVGTEFISPQHSAFRRLMGGALLSFSSSQLTSLSHDNRDRSLHLIQDSLATVDALSATNDNKDNEMWRLIAVTYNIDSSVERIYEQLSAARSHLARASAARLKSVGATPDNYHRQTIAEEIESIGDLDKELGHKADALAQYQQAIDYITVKDEKYHPDNNLALVSLHVKLLAVRAELLFPEQRAEAEKELTAALVLANMISEDGADRLESKMTALGLIGRVWRGGSFLEKDPALVKIDLNNAIRAHEQRLSLDFKLEKTDHSEKRIRSIITSEADMGRDHTILNEYDEARKHQLQRIEYAKKLLVLDNEDNTHLILSYAYQSLASLEIAAGNPRAAVEPANARIAELAALKTPDKAEIAGAYGSYAWVDVTCASFEQALSNADIGLKYDSTQIWILGNKAHALLFLGRKEEAMKIYRDYADKIVPNFDKTFLALALDDFAEFRKHRFPGLDLQLVDQAECELHKTACLTSSARP